MRYLNFLPILLAAGGATPSLLPSDSLFPPMRGIPGEALLENLRMELPSARILWEQPVTFFNRPRSRSQRQKRIRARRGGLG